MQLNSLLKKISTFLFFTVIAILGFYTYMFALVFSILLLYVLPILVVALEVAKYILIFGPDQRTEYRFLIGKIREQPEILAKMAMTLTFYVIFLLFVVWYSSHHTSRESVDGLLIFGFMAGMSYFFILPNIRLYRFCSTNTNVDYTYISVLYEAKINKIPSAIEYIAKADLLFSEKGRKSNEELEKLKKFFSEIRNLSKKELLKKIEIEQYFGNSRTLLPIEEWDRITATKSWRTFRMLVCDL